MEDRDLPPEVIAAYQFVDKMVSEADNIDTPGAPLWHGWALREAFLAGVKWAKKEKEKMKDNAEKSS
jgi:hypothetical protein